MEEKRVGILDELRGFAILCMVVYHTMFNLKYSFGVDVPIFFDGWFNIVRDVFIGIFFFISGTVCNYSRNNLKRGVLCFFAGMMITFVTGIMYPNSVIVFGVLHSLGICMMIYGLCGDLLHKIPPFIGTVVTAFLFFLTYTLPQGYLSLFGFFKIDLPRFLYSGALFPLGFHSLDFTTLDYEPLFPWLFIFICGAYVGIYFKRGVMPKFCYKTHFKPLSWVGKYTIWIYLIHQPLIYGILCLIFQKSIF